MPFPPFFGDEESERDTIHEPSVHDSAKVLFNPDIRETFAGNEEGLVKFQQKLLDLDCIANTNGKRMIILRHFEAKLSLKESPKSGESRFKKVREGTKLCQNKEL